MIAPEDLAERLREKFPDVVVARGEVTVTVPREELHPTLLWLRRQRRLSFDHLSDVSCTDWPGRDPRVWMAYHLYSMRHGHRIRVKVGLSPDDLRLDSVAADFPTADWQEREVYDFYGVTFDGHRDLRRIIMPEGWQGHPLRKDEGLGGVPTQYKGASVPPPDQRGL